MEVKSRQILDVLAELGLAAGKTHSSSLEEFEADKVRAQLRGSRSGGQSGAAASRAPQGLQPKIDLSHISKPGDVLKAILANKQKEEEAEARQATRLRARRRRPVAPALPCAADAPRGGCGNVPAPVRPEPRKIVPQPRSAPPIVAAPPRSPPLLRARPLGPWWPSRPQGQLSLRVRLWLWLHHRRRQWWSSRLAAPVRAAPEAASC